MARAAAPILSGFLGATRTTRRLLWKLLFEVRVAVEALFVEFEQPPGFFVADLSVAQRHLDVPPKLLEQHLGIELDIIQHLAHGIAANDRIQDYVAAWPQAHMHGIG